jgi:hypothetical protein
MDEKAEVNKPEETNASIKEESLEELQKRDAETRKKLLSERKAQLKQKQAEARAASKDASKTEDTVVKLKEKDEKEEKDEKAKPKIRKEQVENAVRFLTHPKVKGSPLTKRIAFLEHKGLTDGEIAEALKTANVSSDEIKETSKATVGTAEESPITPPVPLPPRPVSDVSRQGSTWKGLLLTGVLCLGLGSAASFSLAKHLQKSHPGGQKLEGKGSGLDELQSSASESSLRDSGSCSPSTSSSSVVSLRNELDALRSSQAALGLEVREAFANIKQFFIEKTAASSLGSAPPSASSVSSHPYYPRGVQSSSHPFPSLAQAYPHLNTPPHPTNAGTPSASGSASTVPPTPLPSSATPTATSPAAATSSGAGESAGGSVGQPAAGGKDEEISSLKAELKALRAMLMDAHTSAAVSARPSTIDTIPSIPPRTSSSSSGSPSPLRQSAPVAPSRAVPDWQLAPRRGAAPASSPAPALTSTPTPAPTFIPISTTPTPTAAATSAASGAATLTTPTTTSPATATPTAAGTSNVGLANGTIGSSSSGGASTQKTSPPKPYDRKKTEAGSVSASLSSQQAPAPSQSEREMDNSSNQHKVEDSTPQEEPEDTQTEEKGVGVVE